MKFNIVESMPLFGTVHYKRVHDIKKKMCKQPDSSVGKVAERYSDGLVFEGRSGIPILSNHEYP
jgi:hypothetical protein